MNKVDHPLIVPLFEDDIIDNEDEFFYYFRLKKNNAAAANPKRTLRNPRLNNVRNQRQRINYQNLFWIWMKIYLKCQTELPKHYFCTQKCPFYPNEAQTFRNVSMYFSNVILYYALNNISKRVENKITLITLSNNNHSGENQIIFYFSFVIYCV